MKAYCLASSSSGNCYILEFDIDGVPTRLMVECGIPLKDIYKKAINQQIDVSSVKACLVTHAHGDHSKAAKEMNRLGIPLFATKETLCLINCQGEELVAYQPRNVCDGLFVLPFPVEHDIEGAVGFIVKTKTECVVFVNDHKRWTCDLSNFKPDYIFIECNYDHKVVYAQYYELKKRLDTSSVSGTEHQEILTKMKQHERNLNAHCSLNGTIKGLKKLNKQKCKAIFLMHLSDRYANEYKMKQTVLSTFGIPTYACGKGGGIK